MKLTIELKDETQFAALQALSKIHKLTNEEMIALLIIEKWTKIFYDDEEKYKKMIQKEQRKIKKLNK